MTAFELLFVIFVSSVSIILPVNHVLHLEVLNLIFPSFLLVQDSTVNLCKLGCACALFCMYIHDWVSILASFLKVVIFQYKPQSLDESMPFLLLTSLIPTLLFSYYVPTLESVNTLFVFTIVCILISCAIWTFESLNRKKKSLLNLSLKESFLIGIFASTRWVPGLDYFLGGMLSGFLLDYRLEAMLKYLYLLMMPLLLFDVCFSISLDDLLQNFSLWKIFFILILSFICSWIGIYSFRLQVEKKPLYYLWIYQLMLAIMFFAISLHKD